MGVIKGNRIIYLYRILKDAATDDATAVAFTTENSKSKIFSMGSVCSFPVVC